MRHTARQRRVLVFLAIVSRFYEATAFTCSKILWLPLHQFDDHTTVPCRHDECFTRSSRIHRATPAIHMVVTRPAETVVPDPSVGGKVSRSIRYFGPALAILIFSFASSLLLIAWEDLTCSQVLPSRHRTSLAQGSGHVPSWGYSTINGMGFGITEREILTSASRENDQDYDPMAQIPSYNEIMLQHRTVTIPQWKQKPTIQTVQAAIHTIVSSLQTVWRLQTLAEDYQWETLRTSLHESPIADLPVAASVLRNFNNIGQDRIQDVVGFDWGSCAWRHCGAVADAQEALDELDQLLGVLEPFEVIFCLDIVERSLRDILAVVPWREAAQGDCAVYSSLPVYISKINTDAEGDDVDATSRIDMAYFKALQELRVD